MPVKTDLKRILRTGFLGFSRNRVVSIASILIMTVTLMVIGTLIFLNAILSFSVTQIKDRVDVNIYFYPSAGESEITDLQKTIEGLPEVESVAYVSREQAIADFRERHKDDYLTIQALDELGENPLGASLNVRAKDPSQYEAIVNFLEGDSGLSTSSSDIIEKINYHQNSEIIERLNSITNAVQRLGIGLSVFFVVISILITFNTIRLAIYVSREEISVMRLVGAGNKYIRGPFMVAGLLYGVIATILALALFFPITLWVSKHTTIFFGGMDIFAYYVNNILQILLILLVSGILLGMISSFFAIRKYLKK